MYVDVHDGCFDDRSGENDYRPRGVSLGENVYINLVVGCVYCPYCSGSYEGLL